jgi:CheY-like chemotaxis protein
VRNATVVTKHKPHILCIDDYAPGLELRTLLLNKWGYSVTTALTGEEGLAVLERCAVNAVIVDYVMPGMNGGEVARVVKHRWPEVPIIMVSGHPRVPFSAKTCTDGFISKGSRSERLRSVLSLVLRTEPLMVRTARRTKEVLSKSFRGTGRILLSKRQGR